MTVNDDQERKDIWTRLKKRALYGTDEPFDTMLQKTDQNVNRINSRNTDSRSTAHPNERRAVQTHEADDRRHHCSHSAKSNKNGAVAYAEELGLLVLQEWMKAKDPIFFEMNKDGEKVYTILEYCRALLFAFSWSQGAPFELWNNTKAGCREDAALYASFLIYDCLYKYAKFNDTQIFQDAGNLAHYINQEVFRGELVAKAIRTTNYDPSLHDLQSESHTENIKMVSPLTLRLREGRVLCRPQLYVEM